MAKLMHLGNQVLGVTQLEELTNVEITNPKEGDVLRFNGVEWVNETSSSTNYYHITDADSSGNSSSATYDLPFRFGITEDGQYGYYKAGADTVTPFKSSNNRDIIIIEHEYNINLYDVLTISYLFTIDITKDFIFVDEIKEVANG